MAREADILILAVKPQFLEEVIVQIRDCIREETLLITIAAGKNIRWYEEIYKYRILCNKCGLDLSDFTDDELGLHDYKCGLGTHNEPVLMNKIYHKSTSYYTTQNTTTYRCSVCGIAK